MVRPGILGKEARPQNKAGVVFSILIALLSAILLFVVIQAKLRGVQLPDFVIFIEALGFVVVILAGTWFLIRGVWEHRESEERYRQMASHIQEIFWMLDAESKRVLEVNEAYETITGRTRRSLLDNPTSYEEIIHPEDRVHVLARLDEATRTGKFASVSGLRSRTGTFVGYGFTDFRCATPLAESGGSSAQPRTLPNRNRQKIKLLRT